MTIAPRAHRRLAALAALAGAVPLATAQDAACSARSGASIAPVVELYTSEGCNSCPPADRWLSRLKADPGIVALAFHVDYWDRLGWKDRFASAAYTQRQAEQRATNGARFSYTPQVVVDGVDRQDWYASATPSSARGRSAASVALTLARDGERVVATVQPGAQAPARLAAYWALTEMDHVTAVKAGENEGVTLAHDYVVRDYRPVAAWNAQAGVATTFTYSLAYSSAAGGHARQLNLVVVDAANGRPLQALKLGC